ncbi:hypothetical protein [Aureivirga sp. CE67]|uniref:hypothetical protein n=1 Tax=Aureivirga sp. CE67 TaxID=1788983 RepID=UPI0018C955A7|nr:hypothetical protein [Aureivirga sp. CE67]
MSNDKNDILFELIHSLTKSEKRQFRLYVGRLPRNNSANFITLFDIILKSKKYDEDLILKKTNIKKQQLSNTKAHLYRQLLISLKSNPKHQNIPSQIREQLDFSNVLYNKGLYQQSLKILEKAKNLALKHQETNLAYEIVEFEKIIESQYITRSMSNRADALAIEAKDLSLQNVFSSKLSNLSLQLYSFLLKTGYARNENDHLFVKDYFEKRLPNYYFHELNFKEKLFLHKAFLWYCFIVQDFLGSYKYAKKWVMLFDEYPEMKKEHPVFYLKGMNYLLEALFFVQKQKRHKKILSKLNNDILNYEFANSQNTATLSFLYQFQHQFNSFFLKGDFKKGVAFIPELLENLEQQKSKLDAHHTMLFYYKIACMYFGAGDTKNSIFYLQKIISNKKLKMREDLLCFTRVLNLVAHYEAGIDYNIENLIKTTYKFLIKMNDLHQVQKKMILFLRNLRNLYPHELKGAFVELHKELKEFENHPYEKRSFLYLDILSWLESKIYNKPVETIIQEKLNYKTTKYNIFEKN